MAKQQSAGNEDSKGGGAAGMVGAALTGVATMIGKAWDAIMADGLIAAAGRQGVEELGAALKAFPDSIQVHETGTIFNPTPGEVAANREYGGTNGSFSPNSSPSRQPWPSEIAEQNRHLPGRDHGHDNGHDNGHSM